MDKTTVDLEKSTVEASLDKNSDFIYKKSVSLKDKHNRSVSLRIDHITGRYALRKYRLSPEDYVSKYPNSPFLTCDNLSKETLRVLNHTLAPEESLTMLELKGNCQLELNLSPFEIVLLVFEPL